MRNTFLVLLIVLFAGHRTKCDSSEYEDLEFVEEEDVNTTMTRIERKFNDFVGATVTREELLEPSQLLRKFLEDPLPVKDFDLNIQLAPALAFSQLKVKGLNTTFLDQVVGNISGQFLNISASIPLLQVVGVYKATSYFGQTDGLVTVNLRRLSISARANLQHTADGTLAIVNLDATLDAREVNVDLQSPLVNAFLELLSESIFDHIKDNLLDDLKTAFIQHANEELRKIPLDLTGHRGDMKLVDSIVEKSNIQTATNGNDPMKLPPYKGHLKQDTYLALFESELKLVKGILRGLSTLKRTGDVVVLYRNRTIILEANFGFGNLTGSYEWFVHIMGIGTSGKAQISITDINGKVKIALPLKRRGRFFVESVDVVRLGHIETNVEGLGTGDPITEIVVNLLTNSFKWNLGNMIMQATKDAIQEQLNLINIDLLM